ncbi:hypothetical protein [Mycoplasma sp. 480]|uniref:hypothetical protein n=1 Tax=Mycoplasma sp. 480 TaxID=3440155 RepID=UPI003F50FB96
MKFNILGIFLLVCVLIIQIFIVFVYKINLKIKYQKIGLNLVEKPTVIVQKNLSTKFNKIFNLSLNISWFKTQINIKKSLFFISKENLGSNIFSLVNLLHFNFYCSNIKKNTEKITLIFKYLMILLFSTGWVLLTMDLWIWSLCVLSLFILLLVFEFVFSYKISKIAYIQTKNYIIEKYHNQNLNLILSYLKYKRFSLLEKYLTFYITIIQELTIKFKNWGKNE